MPAKADWLLNSSRGSGITSSLGLLGGEPLTDNVVFSSAQRLLGGDAETSS
ncbi:hypothetical protein PHOSAC3_150267 [Mesotoga infera]|nr:hypothetical protein PHOSAC3_150267 [Mesotoga infera]